MGLFRWLFTAAFGAALVSSATAAVLLVTAFCVGVALVTGAWRN